MDRFWEYFGGILGHVMKPRAKSAAPERSEEPEHSEASQGLAKQGRWWRLSPMVLGRGSVSLQGLLASVGTVILWVEPYVILRATELLHMAFTLSPKRFSEPLEPKDPP